MCEVTCGERPKASTQSFIHSLDGLWFALQTLLLEKLMYLYTHTHPDMCKAIMHPHGTGILSVLATYLILELPIERG